MEWVYLFLAIIFEVAGTISAKESMGFKQLWPSVAMFIFYGLCLSSLSLAMARIELGVAYAVWAGVGTALIALIGIFHYGEASTLLRVGSLLLIIIGVVGLNLSRT